MTTGKVILITIGTMATAISLGALVLRAIRKEGMEGQPAVIESNDTPIKGKRVPDTTVAPAGKIPRKGSATMDFSAEGSSWNN